jgi:hypothetical protein
MPGFGAFPDAAPTGGRTIRVTLDEHLSSIQSPLFAVDRRMSEIGIPPQGEATNMVFVPEVGWQLRPTFLQPGGAFEVNAGQDAVFNGTTMVLADDVEEVPLFRTESLLGVTYDDSPSSGATFFQKRIPAGESFAKPLSADETALPKPDTAGDNVAMDRMAASTADHVPGDAVSIAFFVPGSGSQRSTGLVTLYFTGGVGRWERWAGTGVYALKLLGDGMAALYERGSLGGAAASWQKVHTFRWADAQIYNAHHRITVFQSAKKDGSDYFGAGMAFVTATLPDWSGEKGNRLIESLTSLSILKISSETNTPTYRPRQDSQVAITRSKVRVDVRRDIRALVQVAKAKYPESGTLIDGVVSLPRPPSSGQELTLVMLGAIPTGTTVTLRLLDASTGTELSGRSQVSEPFGASVTYPAPSPSSGVRQRHFRAKVEFETDTGETLTPTMEILRFFSPATAAVPSVTPIVLEGRESGASLRKSVISALSVTQGSRNSSGQVAQLDITDFSGDLERLSNRGSIPVKVEIVRPSLDPVVLFRGHIEEPEERRVAADKGSGTYPARGGRRFQCTASGMWRQVQEQLTPRAYNWINEETGEPQKVTDMARTLLGACFPASLISVPDNPVQLWSSEAGKVTPQGTEILSYLADILDGYLGAYLLWDDSAGTDGLMRVLEAKQPPFTPVAAFSLQTPASGRLQTAPTAYATVTHAASSAVLRPVFIEKKSFVQVTQRAEGNSVEVIGVGGGGGFISQTAINTNSWNPYDGTPDPDHPAYMGREVPIQYYDVGLNGADAVNWMARRIYEVACLSRKRTSFTAPSQLITDPDDALQVRPRPLCFYDPVILIDEAGAQTLHLVMSNTVTGTKAHMMRDNLTLLSVEELMVGSQYQGGMPRMREPQETLRRVMARVFGFPQITPGFVMAKGMNQIQGLGPAPGQALAQIQDLNPASASFGEFF